jgi:predicted peroxiredoxin
MTDKILITISCGTDNPNRATRGLFLAMMAHKQGKEVTVFLLDDGVFLARKGMADHIKAATGDSADDHLTYIQEFGIPVLACTPCAASRLIEAADLIDGARMATGGELIELSCQSTAVLSL